MSGRAEEELEKTRAAKAPYSPSNPPRSWESMSMGEGRQDLRGWPGDCPDSPDPEKRHNCVAVSNVQSVEHFVCQICGWEEWD